MISIGEQIRRHAKSRPDDVALLCEDPGLGIRTYSFAELCAAASRIERSLSGGVHPSPFVLVATATFISVATIIALVELSQPFVLVSPSLTAVELSTVLRRSGGRRLLRTDQSPSCIVGEGPQRTVAAGLTVSKVAMADGSVERALPLTGSHLIQMTSGSLGESRLAMRPLTGVTDEIQSIGACLDFQAGRDRVLCASAIAHSYGCIGGMLAPLFFGISVVLSRDQESARRIWPATSPTIVVGLASTYETILANSVDQKALQASRLLLSAGAPLPFGLFEAFMDHSGLPIQQDYGTTETGTISIDYGLPPSPHSVGRPLPHVEVRIRPPVDEPMHPGEEGEIQVRSSAVAPYYVTNDHLAQALDTEGWYHTGDMGAWNSDGRLHVGRRLRPLIQLSTGNIRPETVEAEIARLRGVLDVAVMQQRLSGGGRGLKAVVAATGLRSEDIRDWCRSHLPPGQVPDIIDVVSHLPRSPAGKVLHKYMIEPVD